MHTFHSDAELVRASIEGKLSAFEELVKRYQNILYRNALCYVRQSEEAQDLVQETFLNVFQELSNLNDPAKFGSWIRTAVRNSCLNVLRSQRRAIAVQEEIERALSEENLDTPSAERKEMITVRELLSHLPEESAQAFVMHYIEDVPIKSIAQQLDRSPQSIKQRLYRARHQLQQEVLKMVKDNVEREKLPDDFPGQVVAKLLETGRKERLYMHFDKARGHFRDALEVAPEDPEILFELGRTHDIMEWPDVETLERAAASVPDSVEVVCELEIAYRQPGFEQAHETAFQQCLKLCEERLTDDPKDVRALKSKARLQIGANDYANAEKLLRVAVEEAPDDQEALFYLALSLGRQSRYEEASKLYEEVCEVNPKSVWAFSSLRNLSTHLAFRKGDGGRAVELMEEVWQLKPVPNEADNLIYFYSATEQLQKALEVFDTAGEHAHHSRVYATIGIACMKNGDLGRAEKMMESAIESTSNPGLRAEAQIHLARIRFALGKSDEAKKVLEGGLKLDLAGHASLAQRETSAFWLSWTKWLAETLESLQQKDPRVKSLLQAVREEL